MKLAELIEYRHYKHTRSQTKTHLLSRHKQKKFYKFLKHEAFLILDHDRTNQFRRVLHSLYKLRTPEDLVDKIVNNYDNFIQRFTFNFNLYAQVDNKPPLNQAEIKCFYNFASKQFKTPTVAMAFLKAPQPARQQPKRGCKKRPEGLTPA